MSGFLKSFQMGKLLLSNNIFYAPLAGCSDFPFRKMSARYRPGIMYCEMVKMDALVRQNATTLRFLDHSKEMHPIGGQLCGSKPEIAGQAARMIEDLGFDVVDLNCGCPVDKVTKDGSGSGLLKNPELIGEIVSNMVAAVNIPVTIKIRAGWDENQICCEEVTRIAEQAGAVSICVHGRTRKQGYQGPANWDYIKRAKAAATTIKVVGNGDVNDPQSAERMFQETGCDAVLVARGTMGQPWIVEDIISYFQGQEVVKRNLSDYRQALMDHFLETLKYQPEHRVGVEMRRVGCWYIKKSAGTKAFREQMSRAETPEQVRELILNFPLGEMVDCERREDRAEAEAEVGDAQCCVSS